MNFDVACTMDYRKYPKDIQLCKIRIGSWGHQSKQEIEIMKIFDMFPTHSDP